MMPGISLFRYLKRADSSITEPTGVVFHVQVWPVRDEAHKGIYQEGCCCCIFIWVNV